MNDQFIYHPASIPLKYRQIITGKQHSAPSDGAQDCLGLYFLSENYVELKSMLEISFVLRDEQQTFQGTVVSIKRQGEQYEIGLRLLNKTDSARLRIIEQICHIEVYMQHKHHQEEPLLCHNHIAAEWISSYAAEFPTI